MPQLVVKPQRLLKESGDGVRSITITGSIRHAADSSKTETSTVAIMPDPQYQKMKKTVEQALDDSCFKVYTVEEVDKTVSDLRTAFVGSLSEAAMGDIVKAVIKDLDTKYLERLTELERQVKELQPKAP